MTFLHRDDEIYFPKPIETLIEEDLERLEAEKNKLENGDDEDEDEDDDKEQEDDEEGNKGELAELPGSINDNEGGPGELVMVTPQFADGLVPGLDYTNIDEVKEYFDSEDLILGVRIYTQGGKVVSLTGKVIGEKVDVEEKGKGKGKGRGKGKGKKDEEDDEDAWEDED